jgi:hypothetical protein
MTVKFTRTTKKQDKRTKRFGPRRGLLRTP